MEKLARAQYLKNKNPKDCALLYIALNRIQVLAGLFKISKDEKDKPLVGFLSRNFQVFCFVWQNSCRNLMRGEWLKWLDYLGLNFW